MSIYSYPNISSNIGLVTKLLLYFVKPKYAVDLANLTLTTIGYKKLFNCTYVVSFEQEVLKDTK